jgi:hypothetical protein
MKAEHDCIHLSSQLQGRIKRTIAVQGGPGINARPHFKNNQSKKSMAQMIERKALSSNTSTTKKNLTSTTL